MKENNININTNKGIILRLFLIISLVLILMAMFFLSSCKLFVAEKEKPIPAGIEVEVEIEKGMTLRDISALLEDKGIVDNGFLFRLYVQQKGKETELMPGVYKLKTGSEYEEVLESIISSPPEIIYKLAIPEGYTVKQISYKIANEIPFIEHSDIEKVLEVKNYDHLFLRNIESLEGFLFPKTYEITINYSAMDIIGMMLDQYQTETENLDYSFARENNLTDYDILIIASMIEREAYIPEERPLISAVIYNRLNLDMTLGIDATISYYLDKWGEPLTISDLEVDSPYNTRIYQGLPPTPICNPGIASIKAALKPADVDYLYYVITDSETGKHTFTHTYDEHIKVKSEANQQN